VKELDFLPEWYKDDKRRQSRVRKQYVALVAVFLVMMAFNATAIRRAGKAAAEMASLENHRVCSEAVVHEFDTLTKKLNLLKTRASLVEQMDSRVDIAAVLAEMSHIIGDAIVLRKVEIVAEPLGRTDPKGQAKGSVVRLAQEGGKSEKEALLGRVKFRIVLTGVAARPADVPDLVCKLAASSYFQQVQPLFYGNAKTQLGTKPAPGLQDAGTAAKTQNGLDVTEFEIACYLANYKEMEEE